MSFRIRAHQFKKVELIKQILMTSLGFVFLCLSWGKTFANEWEADLEIQTTGYIGKPVNRPNQKLDSILDGHVRGKFGKSFVGAFDLDIGADLSGRADHYFSPTEMYFGTQQENWELYFGRKTESWSDSDEYWKSGLWQPRYRRDFFHPKSVGLTGFFAKARATEKWEIAVLATPFFIPERGPTFGIVDGQFQSDSPFWDVQSGFKIFGQPTELRYRMNEPAIKDVILNPGASVSVRFKESPRSDGAWGQFAYGYKPMNQLRLAYIPEINTPQVQGEIDLTPEVVYHHLSTAEAGYRLKRYAGWISWTSEFPESPSIPSRGNVQNFSTAHTLSTFLSWDVRGEAETATQLSVGYLHLFGGKTQDIGDLEIENGSVFEPRYTFHDAISFGIRSPLPLSQRLIARARLIHDFGIDASFLSTGVEYRGSSGWALGLSADIVGVGKRNATSATRGKDFLSRFQGNDRIRGGVSYAF